MTKVNLLKSFILINLSLVILFIMQFSSLISINFEVYQSEAEIKELSLDNERMSFNFLDRNKFENLENLAGQLGFQRTDKVEYIQVLSSEMASRPQ